MVVRIPDAGEPAAFGPPLETGPADPLDALPDGAREQVDRMQARDDALFVAGTLAEMSARQRAAVAQAESAAFERDDGLEGAADGFAATLDAGFDADLAGIVEGARGLSGPRPSDDALDLLTRRAAGLKRGLGARAVVMEDALRRRGQAEGVERATFALRDMVTNDPDAYDEAKSRLTDLAAAAAPLVGADRAKAMAGDARALLGEAAAGGLIARDSERAIEAIRAGAFDDDLDQSARDRLVRGAEHRTLALRQDAERDRASDARAQVTARAAATAEFTGKTIRAIQTGQARLADIVDAETGGIIAPAQAERLRARIAERDAAEARRDQDIARVTQTIADGNTLDPANVDDRAAAEAYFDAAVIESLEVMTESEIAETLPRHAAVLGIVPAGIGGRMRGILIGGAPEGQVAAALAYERLHELDPTLFDALPRPDKKWALRLYELSQLDLPPDDAVRLAKTAPEGSLHADAILLAAETDGGEIGPSADSGGDEAESADSGGDKEVNSPDVKQESGDSLSIDDNPGPESGRFTSGTTRRGADRIDRSFDRQTDETREEGPIPPPAGKHPRANGFRPTSDGIRGDAGKGVLESPFDRLSPLQIR